MSAPQPVTPSFNLDLGAMDASILADPTLNLQDNQPAAQQDPVTFEDTQPPVTPSTPPVQQTQSLQTPAPEATPPAPIDPQEQERGYLRDKDYRQKTMSLADERKAFETERQAQFAQLQLEQQRVQEYWAAVQQQLQQAQPQQPAFDPNTPITLGQAQQLLQHQLQQQEHAILTAQNRKFFEVEKERYRLEFQSEMERHVRSTVESNKLLQNLAGDEPESLYESLDVAAKKLKPKDISEYKTYVNQIADARAARQQKLLDDHAQAAVMRHTKVTQKPSIPTGGTAPSAAAAPKHKFGTQALQDSLVAELEAEKASW